MLKFTLIKKDKNSKARLGQIETAHGIIDTPAFMPVGTCGTVKGMMSESVAETGAQILLGNTYHLMLRPGADNVEFQGGLHKMMNWDKPILTDSGGFQVMSLSKIRKINEKGVTFQSHIDGSTHHLTPESSIDIQRKLDADITMSFDECTPFPCEKNVARESMLLSMRWAKRSKDAFVDRDGYGIFGIQQGSIHEDLRKESAEKLIEIGFDGYAMGGLAVGEGQDEMFKVLDFAPDMLPQDKPRYLMGVGKPDDLVGAVLRGVDMFDCVMPSRSGRTGQAFTRNGPLNMKNAKYKEDLSPVDETCDCPLCTKYTKSYLNHLIKANEILGIMLLTWHNIRFYEKLMEDMRTAIKEENLQEFADDFLSKYKK
jgi:queuine tRNA-ribosyltransferase